MEATPVNIVQDLNIQWQAFLTGWWFLHVYCILACSRCHVNSTNCCCNISKSGTAPSRGSKGPGCHIIHKLVFYWSKLGWSIGQINKKDPKSTPLIQHNTLCIHGEQTNGLPTAVISLSITETTNWSRQQRIWTLSTFLSTLFHPEFSNNMKLRRATKL